MARAGDNTFLKGISGKIGEQFIVRQYKGKIVISAIPDMSRVKASADQKKQRKVFAEAIKYAKAINDDPVKKADYAKKVKDGQTVFHYAMGEYFRVKGERTNVECRISNIEWGMVDRLIG